MNSIYGRWLGQMSHSGDFARWPHLGPIRPMARGGHLGPLSYVYGYMGRYRAEILSRNDPCNEIRAPVRRYELIIWRCTAVFVPKSAISEMGRCGSTGKRAIGGKKSNREETRLGDPRWCAKWLGAIRGDPRWCAKWLGAIRRR